MGSFTTVVCVSFSVLLFFFFFVLINWCVPVSHRPYFIFDLPRTEYAWLQMRVKDEFGNQIDTPCLRQRHRSCPEHGLDLALAVSVSSAEATESSMDAWEAAAGVAS